MSIQVPLILSHMRREPKAPRLKTGNEAVLVIGRGITATEVLFLSTGSSYFFPKETPTYNTFFPSLHNFFPKDVYGKRFGDLQCQWLQLLPRVCLLALPGLLLPPLLLFCSSGTWQGRTCEQIKTALPPATSLTLRT